MFALTSSFLARTGLAGVFLLMLLENVVPIIPSELILPLAGYGAARGRFDPDLAIAAATVGSVLGGLVWYAAARRYGVERPRTLVARHGRWLPVSSREINRADAWFKRWGPLTVCLGRALPGVRAVICIPAGLARMPLRSFLIWSSLGAFAWSDALISSGYALKDHYAAVQDWLNPVTDVALATCVALYLVRVATYRPDTTG